MINTTQPPPDSPTEPYNWKWPRVVGVVLGSLLFLPSQPGVAASYDWYADTSHLPDDVSAAIWRSRNLSWDNPANWANSYPIKNGAPGTREDDVVTIRNIGFGVPTGMNGRIDALHFIGPGSRTAGGSIRIRSQLSMDSTDSRFTHDMQVTLESTATFSLAGGNNLGNSVIENAGVIHAGFAPSSALYGGRIFNSGTMQIGGGLYVQQTVIDNRGQIEKSDGNTISDLHAEVTNATNGIIEVKSGTLRFLGGTVLNQGEIRLSDPSARMLFDPVSPSRGLLVAAPGSRVTGAGILQVNALRVDGDVVADRLVFGRSNATGLLYGGGRLTVLQSCQGGPGGAYFLGGGETSSFGEFLDATPIMEIVPGAELILNSGQSLLGRRLENRGRIRLAAEMGLGADKSGRPGVLYNHPKGIVEGLPPGVGYTGFSSGVCTNEGEMIMRGARLGVGQVPFVNSGRIEVVDGHFTPARFHQSSGEMQVNSNALLTVYGPFSVTGGVLSGSGAIRSTEGATIGAILSPGPGFGKLQLMGLYSASQVQLLPTTILDLEIGGRVPQVEHDQLSLTGGETATRVDGTLKVTLTKGFVPSLGDTFQVVDYRANPDPGRFHTYDFSPLPEGLGWLPIYQSDRLLLVVTNGPPAEAPTVVSAASLRGNRIDVCFSEIVDIQTATNALHYRIGTGEPGAEIESVVLRSDRKSASLILKTPVIGSFELAVDGVLDEDIPRRSSQSHVTGHVLGWETTDIGIAGDPAVEGGAFACSENQFEITAAGSTVHG